MGQLVSLLAAMRPRQWTKNFVVFLPMAFTINLAWDPGNVDEVLDVLASAASAFGLFCLLSSAVYLLNDLADAEKDRLHPKKALRGVASGRLSKGLAAFAAMLFVGAALPLGFLVEVSYGWAQLAYVGISVVYIIIVRQLVILDVFAISAGFIVRAAAGALVISADPSPWLYICTGLGALFIGFAKRRQEMLTLKEDGTEHRASLGGYSLPMLDHLITMLMASTLIAYILYTFTADNLPPNDAMMFTIPFVAFGIARYFYLIHAKQAGGNPEDILLKDVPILLSVVWLAGGNGGHTVGIPGVRWSPTPPPPNHSDAPRGI